MRIQHIRYRFNRSTIELATYWEPRIRKDGKPGALVSHSLWFTPLRTCVRCGKVGVPKKVQYRSMCHQVGFSGMLCMGCWNVIRPIVKAQTESNFLSWAIGKIQREVRKHGNEKRRIARNADVGN